MGIQIRNMGIIIPEAEDEAEAEVKAKVEIN